MMEKFFFAAVKLSFPMAPKYRPKDLAGKPIEWFGPRSYEQESRVFWAPIEVSSAMNRLVREAKNADDAAKEALKKVSALDAEAGGALKKPTQGKRKSGGGDTGSKNKGEKDSEVSMSLHHEPDLYYSS